jgi:hypothetical protein
MWEPMQWTLWKIESEYSQLYDIYGNLLCNPHDIDNKHDSMSDSNNISYLYQWAPFSNKSITNPAVNCKVFLHDQASRMLNLISRVVGSHVTITQKNKAWISHQGDFCCHGLPQVRSLVRSRGGSGRVSTSCHNNPDQYLIKIMVWRWRITNTTHNI